jgi:hypothetical protein
VRNQRSRANKRKQSKSTVEFTVLLDSSIIVEQIRENNVRMERRESKSTVEITVISTVL